MLTEEQRKLIEDNHNLIYSYIYTKQLPFSEFYDLFAIALCRAAMCYNTGTAQFSTYAYKCFDMALSNFYAYQNRDKRKIQEEIYSLEHQYNFPDGDAYTLGDTIMDDFDLEEDVSNKILCKKIKEYIEKYCTEKEKYVFFELLSGRTLQDIGNEFGVTRERIRQINNKVIQKIKRKFLLY